MVSEERIDSDSAAQCGFHLAGSAVPSEAEVLRGILVFQRLTRGLPHHLEAHACGRGDGVQCGPAGLIDNRDVVHFECEGVPIRTDRQTVCGYGNGPIESGGRDGRVQIVDLVCKRRAALRGDRRSPKERESYVGERALLRRAGSPVFPVHDAIVRRRRAKRDAIALIIRAHARKGAAASGVALEMVNMRGLEVRASGLVMAAIFVQPGNGVGIGAAICGGGLLSGFIACCGNPQEGATRQRRGNSTLGVVCD